VFNPIARRLISAGEYVAEARRHPIFELRRMTAADV